MHARPRLRSEVGRVTVLLRDGGTGGAEDCGGKRVSRELLLACPHNDYRIIRGGNNGIRSGLVKLFASILH